MNTNLERRIVDLLLGKPLVSNVFRGTLVEAILADALEPDWFWCAADWASHDFENASGVKLEVKQSAALQTWHADGVAPTRGNFDIKARIGRYEGSIWHEEPGRAAQIYVFAWHPETDPAIADHRMPEQWQFYPVLTSDLPDQKTIARSRIAAIGEPVSLTELPKAIERLLA